MIPHAKTDEQIRTLARERKKQLMLADEAPIGTPVNIEAIPPEMKVEPRWVVWKWERINGKWTKPPLFVDAARKVHHASTTNPATWMPFEAIAALLERFPGIGIGFMLGDGWSGVDLDHCYVDGQLTAAAKTIADSVGSYAEFSPTTGVKAIVRGTKPPGPCEFSSEDLDLEVYSNRRYFTITGQPLNGHAAIADGTNALARLQHDYLGEGQDPSTAAEERDVDALDKLKPRQERIDAATAAMAQVEINDGSDGSRRLMSYCRRAVRWGLPDEDAVETIGKMLEEHPAPKDWPDEEIVRRLGSVKAVFGEAVEDPWAGIDVGGEAAAADDLEPLMGEISNGTPRKKQLPTHFSGETIVRNILEKNRGWPKLAGDVLFVRSRQRDGDLGLMAIIKPTALRAWLSRSAACEVCILGAPNVLSMESIFEAVKMSSQVDRYDQILSAPHFPPMPKTLYVNPIPTGQGAKPGKLDEFLALFKFASELDRLKAKALTLSLFWGGPGGQRRHAVIDAKGGTGSGKTTFAEKLCDLVGAPPVVINFTSRNFDEEKAAQRLVRPGWENSRVVLCDNLKGNGIANQWVESQMTAKWIQGDVKYAHERRRTNDLTWILTINDGSFRRDFAARLMRITVESPTEAERRGWNERIDAFIEVNRRLIIEEIASIFGQGPQPVENIDRWQQWCREIVGRLGPKRNAVMACIGQETEEMDVDSQIAAELREEIDRVLFWKMIGPKMPNLFISSHHMKKYLETVTGKRFDNELESSKYLGQLIGKGAIKWLAKAKKLSFNGEKYNGFILNPSGSDVTPEKLFLELVPMQETL